MKLKNIIEFLNVWENLIKRIEVDDIVVVLGVIYGFFIWMFGFMMIFLVFGVVFCFVRNFFSIVFVLFVLYEYVVLKLLLDL